MPPKRNSALGPKGASKNGLSVVGKEASKSKPKKVQAQPVPTPGPSKAGARPKSTAGTKISTAQTPSASTRPEAERLTVGQNLLLYIRKVRGERIDKIEKKYTVTFTEPLGPTNGDILVRKNTKGNEKLLKDAVEEFTSLVQKCGSVCTTKTLVLRDDVQERDVDSALAANDDIYVIAQKDLKSNPRQLILYGQENHIEEMRANLSEIIVSRRGHGQADKHRASSSWNNPQIAPDIVYDHKLKCGTVISIKTANIIEEKVDAIVNPANVRLQHGGGLALAIANAAGPKLNTSCRDILKRKGPLQISQVEESHPGKLHCRWVLHAAGPYVKLCGHVDLLKKTFENIFKKCSKLKISSVAIPAISTGLYGIPVDVCANAMVKAIQKLVVADPNKLNTVKDIRIMDIDANTVLDIIEVFNQTWRDRNSKPPLARSASSPASPDQHPLSAHFDHQQANCDWPVVASAHQPNTSQLYGFDTFGLTDSTWAPASNPRIHIPNRSSIPSPSTTTVGHRPPYNPNSYSDGAGYDRENHISKTGDKTQEDWDNLQMNSQVDAYAFGSTKNQGNAWNANGRSTSTGYGSSHQNTDDNEDDDTCPICLCDFANKKTLKKCKHSFCKDCLDRAIQSKNACPICNDILGELRGNQPNGTMDVRKIPQSLPGYGKCGTIEISYNFPSGIQTEEHPNPGARYHGTSRAGFLPDNAEGQEVLALLRRAFDARVTFTIGRSNTTGKDNCVIWNDIHHKTSMYGGPTNFGYPDPDYLTRVKEELAAKGITTKS